MNLLAIESATSVASVALHYEGKCYFEQSTQFKQHAKVMLGLVQQLLIQANIKLSALDGIVFGAGPGSFTGLRVACAVAKGLAFAFDLPLYPVSSLSSIAFDAKHENLPVLVMMDARMKEVYWAFENYAMPKVSVPELVLMPEVKACVLAGVGFEAYLSALPAHTKQAIVSQQNISPCAKTMIQLVHTESTQAVSAIEAVPMYVRNQVV